MTLELNANLVSRRADVHIPRQFARVMEICFAIQDYDDPGDFPQDNLICQFVSYRPGSRYVVFRHPVTGHIFHANVEVLNRRLDWNVRGEIDTIQSVEELYQFLLRIERVPARLRLD
jgi:hypothetical protein